MSATGLLLRSKTAVMAGISLLILGGAVVCLPSARWGRAAETSAAPPAAPKAGAAPVGDDPFSSPAPAKAPKAAAEPIADDPFGPPAPAKTPRAAADPFADDPFGEPAPAPSPRKTAAPRKQAAESAVDPFAAPAPPAPAVPPAVPPGEKTGAAAAPGESPEVAELKAQLARLKEQHAKELADFKQEFYRRFDAYRKQMATPESHPQPAEVRLQASLEKPVKFDFLDTPLDQVAMFIADTFDIPVVLDEPALGTQQIEPSAPVTVSLSGVSLTSALNLITAKLGIDWVVQHEVLLLTSTDQAASCQEARLYDVADLLAAGPFRDDGDLTYSYESLIELIKATTGGELWSDQGGPGSMEPFRGTLAVTQRQRVHSQIAKLLADLRQLRQTRSAASSPPATPPAADQFKVLSYPLILPFSRPIDGQPALLGPLFGAPGAQGQAAQWEKVDLPNEIIQLARRQLAQDQLQQLAESLATVIPEMVQPASWKGTPGGEIRAIQGALVVKQTPQVHAQIRRLLEPFISPQKPFGATDTSGTTGAGGMGMGGMGGMGMGGMSGMGGLGGVF